MAYWKEECANIHKTVLKCWEWSLNNEPRRRNTLNVWAVKQHSLVFYERCELNFKIVKDGYPVPVFNSLVWYFGAILYDCHVNYLQTQKLNCLCCLSKLANIPGASRGDRERRRKALRVVSSNDWKSSSASNPGGSCAFRTARTPLEAAAISAAIVDAFDAVISSNYVRKLMTVVCRIDSIFAGIYNYDWWHGLRLRSR